MKFFKTQKLALVVATLVMGLLLSGLTPGALSMFRSPHAAALASGTCPQAGSNDQCVVLLVTLNGKNIPSTGVTVTATRQQSLSGGSDNSFVLNNNSSPSAFPHGKATTDWTERTNLPNNQYTSYYGVYNTIRDQCDPNSKTDFFSISVTGNGVQGQSSQPFYICDASNQNNVFVKTVTINVSTASNPASKGGIQGSASYADTSTNKSGKCSTDSFVEVYGGPDSIDQNSAVQVKIDGNSNFKSGLTFTPGSGYTVDIVCYDGLLSNPAVNKYLTTKNNVTITAGQFTPVDFTKTLPANNNDNSTVTPTCESSGFTLAWIACPIIEGISNAVDGIYRVFIQPLLQINPLSLDPNSPMFKTWSNFRVYGDIFLIIALLVVVFGQSIGGGVVDAYTAKKMLPRLLIAAVLINISYYLVAFAVDVTNIVGNGIQTLLTQPFVDANAFHITMNGGTQGVVIAATGAGLAATIAAIWAAIAAPGVALAFMMPLVQFFLLFVLLPAFLIFLAIFFTVILRQGLIIFLVVVSPVAFALYCLPNTEKYFRTWWDWLFRALLVYPIIAVLFSIGNIMAVVLEQTAQANSLLNTFAQLLSFIGLVAPLIMIPWAFKIAGGILGRFHDFATNWSRKSHEAIKGNPNDPNSLRNRTKRNAGSVITRGRAESYRRLKGRDTALANRAASMLFGSSIEKEALLNQQAKQRIFTVKDNGDDSVVNARASFIDTDGQRKTLDGKNVSDADWMTAQRLYPNLADIQAVADYRSTKVNSTEEAQQFARNFGMMAQQQGLTADEATGIYTGLAFARQNERGEFKYGKYTQNADGSFSFNAVGDTGSYAGDVGADGRVTSVKDSRSANFIKEQYTKRGSWDSSRMFGSYFQSMGDIKKTHLDKLDNFAAMRASGATLSADQLALEQHSKDQLKQIVEMEDTFTRGGKYRDPDTGQIVDSGLAGASAATQSAFNKMREIGVNPSAAPGSTGNAHLDAIRAEIDAGQTYEATHSPDPGDFNPGSRPYTS